MTIETFWQAVRKRLDNSQSVFIALVVANTHGSPGTLGARLLVDDAGVVEGTVGGAIMEAKLIEEAKQRLLDQAVAPTLIQLVHRKENLRGGVPSGLICAGSQVNLSLVLRPDHDRPLIARLCDAIKRQTPATLQIDANGISVTDDDPQQTLDTARLRLEQLPDNWRYHESSIARRRLAIIGAGHCGKALADLATRVGYWVDLYDNRAAMFENAQLAATIRGHKIASYDALAEYLAYPQLTTCVVMTASVFHDIDSLAAIAALPLAWLGVMGSGAKIREIHTQLRERGITAAQVNAIHGPIGLPMKSDTPPEIAVSIIGQLLQRADTR